MVSHSGRTVAKVVDSTLQAVIASESLPADRQLEVYRVWVTKEDMIYLLDNLNEHGRLLCINPAESLEPVLVAQTESRSFLSDLSVTDGGTIYVAEYHQRKILALHPSNPTFTEVLTCPHGLRPMALLIHDRTLFASMRHVLNPSCSGKGREVWGIFVCVLLYTYIYNDVEGMFDHSLYALVSIAYPYVIAMFWAMISISCRCFWRFAQWFLSSLALGSGDGPEGLGTSLYSRRLLLYASLLIMLVYVCVCSVVCFCSRAV